MSVQAWHTPQGVAVMPPCPSGALAVERLGQDARHGGLADAARAGEQVGVVQALRAQRIGQRLHHVLLPHHLAEVLGRYLRASTR